jgi:hypothetical protein
MFWKKDYLVGKLLNVKKLELKFHQCSSTADSFSKGDRHVPSKWTRKALNWSKQFKSDAEIPELITTGQLSKARGYLRFRLGNALKIGTLVTYFVVVKVSKYQSEQGTLKSVSQMRDVLRDTKEE